MNNKLSEQTYPKGIVPHTTWDFQDSTKLKTYQRCPRKYFYEYVLGLRKGDDHNLIWGSAIHKGMGTLYDLYRQNNNKYSLDFVSPVYETFLTEYRQYFDEITDIDKEPKNPPRAERLFKEYMEWYHYDTFEVVSIETYFRFDLSDAMTLVGKLDLSVLTKRDELEILEHKTTKWNDRRWSEQWANSIQVNNYALAGYIIHPNFKQIKVNGLKTFKSENAKNAPFERVPVNKGIHGIEDSLATCQYWMARVNQDFDLLSQQKVDSNSMTCFGKTGESCMDFGRTCVYKPFCENCYNPIKDIDMLQRNFEVKFWDPIEEVSPDKIQVADLRR